MFAAVTDASGYSKENSVVRAAIKRCKFYSNGTLQYNVNNSNKIYYDIISNTHRRCNILHGKTASFCLFYSLNKYAEKCTVNHHNTTEYSIYSFFLKIY